MIKYVFNPKQTSSNTFLNPLRSSRSWGGRLTGLLLAGLLFTSGVTAIAASNAGSTSAGKQVAENYGKIPLSFEPNKGQTDPSVQFLSRGSGYSLFLTQNEVVLNLERQRMASPSQTPGSQPGVAMADTLRMKLLGANPNVAVTGLEPQSGVVSYLIGNDPKKWHTGIQTFGKVNFAQVYPGVDLVFYGNQRQLEYDFVVAPGADPSRIAWQIDGAKPSIDADGNLALSASNGPAGFKKPILYQMDGDKKISVDGAFTVAGNRIGFKLGSYDHAKALIIDPVLTYATYLGGSTDDYIGGSQNIGIQGLSGNNVDQGIAFDSQGSAYVVGVTDSTDFPVQNPYQSNPYGTKIQAFGESNNPTTTITKFSPDGSSLVYSTYLGGSNQDYGEAIAVDANGEAFVVGQTHSPDFPITSGAYQTICSPQDDGYKNNQEDSSCGPLANGSAFVTKLNANGSALVYSTFLGGYGTVSADAIAIDGMGRAYIGGSASFAGCKDVNSTTGEIPYPYTCFPTTGSALVSGQAPENGHIGFSGFVAVFDPTGANLLYSSLFNSLDPNCSTWSAPNYLCGSNLSGVNGVAVDASGNFYIVGETNTTSLPTTTGVIQPTTGPVNLNNPLALALYVQRGFVAKFTPVTTSGGALLAYATYLGGKIAGGSDMVSNITTDADGYAYVSGLTDSTDFPVTTGAYQTSAKLSSASSAAFVAKLNPTGTAIEWATYLGNATGNLDGVSAVGPIQLDGNGNVYVTGKANAGNFPWVGNMEPYNGAPVFVSELDPTGSKLLFSTEFGTGLSDNMTPAGLAVDSAGNMYVAFDDNCAGTIVTPGSFQQTNHMQSSGCAEFSTTGFVAKISATGTVTVALAASPSPASAGQSVTLTATVRPTATYASVPTGTITFQDGGTTLTTATLNASGVATYTTSTLLPETHSLTAVYSGDSTYPTASGAASLTVTGLTASVNVAPATGTTSLAASLSVKVTVTGSGATPTGTVTLSGGGYNSSAATLSGGIATIVIPANSLSAGSDTLTVSYSGDANYGPASGSAPETVTIPLTPTITVQPAASTSAATSSLSVKVTVTGSGATPSGTVTLSGGGYTSAATALAGGIATIVIPANSLSAGNDTLTASYSGDANYSPATGGVTGTAAVKVLATPLASTVTVTPATSTLNSGSTLSVTVAVTGAGVTPSGTVTLSGGGYTSTAQTLVGGAYTFVIPANSLSAGTDTLTGSYSGDANYASSTGATSGSTSPIVTASVFSLAASTPAAVAPGSSATSTITVKTTTGYTGTVTLTCALTSSPTGAINLPTCSTGSSIVTLSSGTTTGTATVTVSSTTTTSELIWLKMGGRGGGWAGAGGGTFLAFVAFLGIPARRRRWLSMLGIPALAVALAGLSACGGTSSPSGTTAGSYTFTVTGTGSPAETPVPTTTFTLAIN
jgi:hypothetical protein